MGSFRNEFAAMRSGYSPALPTTLRWPRVWRKQMNQLQSWLQSALALVSGALSVVPSSSTQAADEPLALARDGFMYVGGRTMKVDGRDYVYGQMYVEIRIPAKQTKPYPIIMVHGGTMSGTNFTG